MSKVSSRAKNSDPDDPYDGRIKEGEVRNPYGRRGKPKPIETDSAAQITADILSEFKDINIAGKASSVSHLRLLLMQTYNVLISLKNPYANLKFLSYCEKIGVFDIMRANSDDLTGPEDEWTDELEECFKLIEADFVETDVNRCCECGGLTSGAAVMTRECGNDEADGLLDGHDTDDDAETPEDSTLENGVNDAPYADPEPTSETSLVAQPSDPLPSGTSSKLGAGTSAAPHDDGDDPGHPT